MSERTEVDSFCTHVESFAAKHLELIELERVAEIKENAALQESCSAKFLQKKGVCIPKMRIANFATGLFGRSLLNFESFYGKTTLPTHTITSGDIVGIGNLNSDGKIEIIASGVVTRVTDTIVSVAFEKNSNFSDLESDTQYVIIKLANDITYKRLKRALKNLESKGRDHNLVEILFGSKKPSVAEESKLTDLQYYNNCLNDEQKEAVKFALSQKEIAVIHGPPGTGKTTTVVECIRQAVAQKLKILACAPSNIAVDNLVEKLSSHKIKMVRLGHPARFLTNIQQYSLDAIISNYDGSNVVKELHKEIEKLRKNISKTKGSYQRKSMWAENRSLLKEVKEREKIIVQHVIKNADVVLCTLTSGSDDGPLKYIDNDHFNMCFIDECSQSIEAACWIPLLMVKKCVLAGDHCQLPPTIISKKATKEGLELTLMERILKLHGDGIKKMLTTQYRMNRVIMTWPSEQLYENKLVASDSVTAHLLADLPGIEDNDDTTIPLLLIDTTGCGLSELQAEDDESKGNEGEADLVAIHIKNLVKSGLSPADIAVITPYNLQVELIKTRISKDFPKLEIKSVDGFQGREKEAVVLSLVRSNDTGEVGFLTEDRRINVAITRARRHLAVICDSKTVSYHAFLKSFLRYCEEKGEVRSAFQYTSEIGNYPSVKPSVQKSAGKTKVTKCEKTSAKKILNGVPPVGEKEHKSRPHLTSEGDKKLMETKYLASLQDFKNSDEITMRFPTTLSSFERMIIHEISETLDLLHISTGEGTERCLEVQKKGQSVTAKDTVNNSETALCNENKSSVMTNITTGNNVNKSSVMTTLSDEENDNNYRGIQSDHKESKPEESLVDNHQEMQSNCKESKPESLVDNRKEIQSNCKESKPKESLVHNRKEIQSNCTERKPKESPGATKDVDCSSEPTHLKNKAVKKKKPSKPKLKVLNLTEKKTSDGEEDFDSLIEQVMKADNTCRFTTCKKSVAILVMTCKFCKGRFCCEHSLPEIHGCGDAAKSAARSQIRKDGVIYPGSGRPEKKVDAFKHSYLQKKLDKKIGELSGKRKVQKKEKSDT